MHREDYEAKGAEELQQLLAQRIASPSITRHEYNNVRVVIDSDSTCLPAEEFQPENLERIYKEVFSTNDLEQEKVCYTMLPELGVVEAFTIPQSVYSTILGYYPSATIANSYAMVMQRVAAFSQRRKPAAQPLYVYIQGRQLFVFSIYEDKLLFANSFEADQEQNSLFFVLSVWKELQLDVRENYCFIGGDNALVQSLMEEVRDYLLHVEQMNSIDLIHL